MQVALDGPNVTLLFLKIYEEKRCLNQLPALLDIGIWGFHTIRGSLKNSEKASECDIRNVLKSICKYFEMGLPTRRENLQGSWLNSTRWSAKFRYPTTLQGSQWPSGQK